MITTTLYWGQGLGNQLWSWATLSTIGIDNGFKWGIQAPWRFKGKSFLKLDFGCPVMGVAPQLPSSKRPWFLSNYYRETKFVHKTLKFDISEYDSNLTSIRDGTKIDGTFQAEKYISHHKSRIQEALAMPNPFVRDENVCVIHIRGGDYSGHRDLILSRKYYQDAVEVIRKQSKGVRFLIVTNDVKLARSYLPELKVESKYSEREIYSGPSKKTDVRTGLDFALMQHARYLILANSSFSWWAAWTNIVQASVIAPKFWARHNLNNGYWSTADILTEGWNYLDVEGRLSNYEDCLEEFAHFRKEKIYLKTRCKQK